MADVTSGAGAVGTPGAGGRRTPVEGRPRLLPHEESDKLEQQPQHAVSGFVDEPHASVEEADHVLEAIASRFTDAVTRRRRTLRNSWQSMEAGKEVGMEAAGMEAGMEGGEDKPATTTDTEQLRMALRDYRELAEQLLHI